MSAKIKLTLPVMFALIVCGGILPGKAQAKDWYVDNAVSVSGSGESWASAWKNFSNIVWSSIKGGDTLYLSGGSSSKIYPEALTIGASGTGTGAMITVTVGANHPTQSAGHSGTVILDGGGVRPTGINVSGRNYITINGLAGSVYRLNIRNVAGTSNNSAASVFVGSGNYVNIDYLDIDNARSYGVKFNNVDHLRVRGCDIRTGVEAVDIFTDGIYGMVVANSVFENNVVIAGNSADSALHVDAMQLFGPSAVNWGGENLIIRNNYFEYTYGSGNVNAQTFITEDIGGYMYFYNNVIIGSSYTHYQAALFKDVWPGGDGHTAGVVYVWNNTIVSQYPSGGLALNMGNLTEAQVGAIYNNILVVPNSGTGISKTYANADYNCYYGCTARGGSHNIVANPQYSPDDEYRLNSNSPCINAGIDLSNRFNFDRDGKARPIGSAWDIGAYEYGSGDGATPTPVPCSGDVFGDDRFVNLEDFRVVMDKYRGTSIDYDIDGDNQVTTKDLAAVVKEWGRCP